MAFHGTTLPWPPRHLSWYTSPAPASLLPLISLVIPSKWQTCKGVASNTSQHNHCPSFPIVAPLPIWQHPPSPQKLPAHGSGAVSLGSGPHPPTESPAWLFKSSPAAQGCSGMVPNVAFTSNFVFCLPHLLLYKSDLGGTWPWGTSKRYLYLSANKGIGEE